MSVPGYEQGFLDGRRDTFEEIKDLLMDSDSGEDFYKTVEKILEGIGLL